jgi:pimeloyl-ACP methyl ester carboxylesterase
MTIDQGGVRIHAERRGEGVGVPLLLTHGFSATSAMFASTVDALAPSRPCVTWDVRGHGASDSPDDPAAYSIPLSVADMVAILDAEGIDRVVLLGHSMGGYLSLEFVRAHPERVAALVLVGTGPGYRNDSARAEWNEMCESFARSLENRGLDGLPAGSDEARSELHRSADGLARAARGILRQHDAGVLDHLPQIAVPSLVLVGERDRRFLAGASYMAARIPDVDYAVLPGAGHTPMLSHPAPFQAAVRRFLDRVDSGANAHS